VVNGVPVLVHEERSVFRIADYLNHRTPAIQRALAALDELLTQVVPALATNLKARKNFVRLTEALLERTPSPRVLVIGRRILGKGMEDFASHPALELVETDVAFGPRTKIICDAHDLPFADASFDGVVVQAVLEHVADPARCVEEIHRILKPEGVVYAETPFMQ
jgi:SAM-dependent methyltransferase